MLILNINGDIYKLYSDTKKQMKLKRELLGRYRGDVTVKIEDKGVMIDECKLDDLFSN